jgi:hypothetical protein
LGVAGDDREGSARSSLLTPAEVGRLREAVLARQAELGIFAKSILAPATWSGLMAGRSMRLGTTHQIDDALRWRRGSAYALARGEGEPVPIDDNRRIIELPAGVRPASVEDVWLAAGRLCAEAAHVAPEVRGQLVAVVNQLIDSYRRRGV